MNNKLYDIIKYAVLTFFPVSATFLGIVLPIAGVSPENVTNIIIVVNAVAGALGGLIGLSAYNYNRVTTPLEIEEHERDMSNE